MPAKCITPTPGTIERHCAYCDAPFRVYRSQTKAGTGRFCSRSCGVKGQPRTPIEERFWAKVSKGAPDDCWLWTGSRDRKGYGQIGVFDSGTRLIRAHRLSWELHHGPIPEGLLVLHRCDTPACVNPEHLFLGTAADNTADMLRKGRARGNTEKGPRPYLPRGERKWSARLTEAQVREIRARYATGGVTRAALAREYGVAWTTIGSIVSGDLWQHLL